MGRTALRTVLYAQQSTFRLEVQTTGKLTGSATNKVEYMRSGEKWIMDVHHHQSSGFAITLRAPEAVKTFAYKPYVRTNDKDILYGTLNTFMKKALGHDVCILGAEVTLPQPAPSTSPWKFTSSEQMEDWDVILRVGESKFYAHKR
ncbi:hypothetical protein AAVH_30970, partial [Aphelenchoides avenae]